MRIALRHDKSRRSWMSFAHLAATILNLRIAEFQSQSLSREVPRRYRMNRVGDSVERADILGLFLFRSPDAQRAIK